MAHAELRTPTEPVVLSVSGLVSDTNAESSLGKVADFDMVMLHQLPFHLLTTSTSWTNGTPVFKGVLLTDLLAKVKAKGRHIRVTALNMYSAEIDIKTIERYPIILAYEMNGKAMAIRDKGPLWIVYPVSDFPELDQPKYLSRMVWQVKSIEVF